MASETLAGLLAFALVTMTTIQFQVRGAAAAFGSSQTLHSRVSASSSSVASSAGGVTVTSSTVNGFTQLSFTTPDGLTCSTTAPAGVWACMQGGSPVMTVPVASLPLGICSPTTLTPGGSTTTVVGTGPPGQLSFIGPGGLRCTSNPAGGWTCIRDGGQVTSIPVAALPQGGVCNRQPTAAGAGGGGAGMGMGPTGTGSSMPAGAVSTSIVGGP